MFPTTGWKAWAFYGVYVITEHWKRLLVALMFLLIVGLLSFLAYGSWLWVGIHVVAAIFGLYLGVKLS